MSDSSFGCVFCLNKTSGLKNKLTADVLKDVGLFQFLCKYLLNNENNSIRFEFDSTEEGMLPVCTKCANRYKELDELYSEFQELETQIKAVVEEFRQFVFSSDYDYEDQQNTSDFHRNFRQHVLQRAGCNPTMDIKEEVIDEIDIETTDIMTLSMNAEYKMEEPIEENFENLSEDNFEETPTNYSCLETNDDQIDQEEGFKSEMLRTTEETEAYSIEPRRSLRNRDTPVSIKKKDLKAKNTPAKKRVKATTKKVKPELDSDSSISSNSSTESDHISTKSVKKNEKVRKKTEGIKVSRPRRRRKEPKKLICTLATCGIELENLSRFRRHIRKHESTTPEADKTLTCPICQKLFAVQRNLKRHVSLHKLQENKNNEAFICQQCDIRCKNQEKLDKHLLKFHQRDVIKFVCAICGSKFKSQSGFDAHVKAHAGVKPPKQKYPCKSCPEVFQVYNQLKKHEFLKHPESATVFPCTVCGNKYYLKHMLDNHLVSHSKEKTYECKICTEKFKTVRGLDAHNIRNHGKDPFTCTLCEKKFSSKSGFASHNRLHHDKSKNWYSHECTICDKKFPSKHKLERHVFYHGSTRDFICEVCGKNFKSPDTLHTHMNCHKNDSNKRYKCDVCKEAFSWYPSHEAHMKSHHGIDISTKRNESTSTITGSAPDSSTTLIPNSAILTSNPVAMNLSSEFQTMYSNLYPFQGLN